MAPGEARAEKVFTRLLKPACMVPFYADVLVSKQNAPLLLNANSKNVN